MKTRTRKVNKKKTPSRGKSRKPARKRAGVNAKSARKSARPRPASSRTRPAQSTSAAKPKRKTGRAPQPATHDRPDRERTSENNRPQRREDDFMVPTSPDVGPFPHGAAAEQVHASTASAPPDPAHAEGHQKLRHRWRPSDENKLRDKSTAAKQRFTRGDRVKMVHSMVRRSSARS